jgi:hypothetical protein
VFLYKVLMFLQRTSQGVEKSWHSFIAGSLGGYLIFGNEFSPVNKQVKNGLDRIHVCLILLDAMEIPDL